MSTKALTSLHLRVSSWFPLVLKVQCVVTQRWSCSILVFKTDLVFKFSVFCTERVPCDYLQNSLSQFSKYLSYFPPLLPVTNLQKSTNCNRMKQIRNSAKMACSSTFEWSIGKEENLGVVSRKRCKGSSAKMFAVM